MQVSISATILFPSRLIRCTLARVCRCTEGVDCHCHSAKKPTRSKPKDQGVPPPISPTSATGVPVPVSIHTLRPVLPRPPAQPSSHEHVVVSHTHPHNHRFSHGSAFFSPYSRAYEEHHYSSEEGHPDSLSENGLATHRSADLMAWSSDSSGNSFPHKTLPPSSFSDLQDEFDSPEFQPDSGDSVRAEKRVPARLAYSIEVRLHGRVETLVAIRVHAMDAFVLPRLLLILLRRRRRLPKMGAYPSSLNH
jgi:hypothetical protein